MKKIIIILVTVLGIAPAYANDPCFDGMCSIEVNITTGKTTKTRLSDAEIAIRLAAKAEADRLAAIAKAEADRLAAIEAANKPAPIIVETATVIVQPVIVETITASVSILHETQTVQTITSVTPTNVDTNASNSQSTKQSVVTQPTTPVVDSNTATSVDTSTVMVIQSTNIQTQPTAVTALSSVIWALKNQILLIQKMYAKILIRTKGMK